MDPSPNVSIKAKICTGAGSAVAIIVIATIDLQWSSGATSGYDQDQQR
jgi:hypothetical protein